MQGQPESTPTAAAKAVAQSQTGGPAAAAPQADTGPCGEGTRYTIASAVLREVSATAYQHKSGKPLYRPLRIYALDPAASEREGRTALVQVPYEPLAAGPVGEIFEVIDRENGRQNDPVNLDSPMLLMTSGREPSPSDPQFRQQMVYAIGSLVYVVFRLALGRPVAWGFNDRNGQYNGKLVLRPHGTPERNAYYSKEAGEIRFGYFNAEVEVAGNNLPKAPVFTCLSHDIVVHELTHAMLDGLRSRFAWPSTGDVLAFHEAFADLVAFFQRFSYRDVVAAGLRESRGDIGHSELFTKLARQFAETTSARSALRLALDLGVDRQTIRKRRISPEPHIRGSVLVAAVFDAFLTVYTRKTDRYVRLATRGTGILPRGWIDTDLLDVLADEATQLASQFLSICIRAIDYCPPLDIEFGEYLRALITADNALVPDDPWGYREALIDAFRVRDIYPRGVDSLTEDALLWREPMRAVPPWPALSFAQLRFGRDVGHAAGPDELKRQARALGELVTAPGHHRLFGLVDPTSEDWRHSDVDLPTVQSIRTTRRVGPDGQIVFDVVAEVTQRRTIRTDDGASFDFYGGATIIIGPEGKVRYTINKRLCHDGREKAAASYMSDEGKAFWKCESGQWQPCPAAFCLLHRRAWSADT